MVARRAPLMVADDHLATSSGRGKSRVVALRGGSDERTVGDTVGVLLKAPPRDSCPRPTLIGLTRHPAVLRWRCMGVRPSFGRSDDEPGIADHIGCDFGVPAALGGNRRQLVRVN
jgi:hypothetical protein